jgi:putative membrane protein
MMWNNCNGMMGGWGWLNAGFSLIFLALLVVGVIWLVRRLDDRSSPTSPRASAEAILAERYARGEIDDQEYQQRLGVLRAKQ